MIVWKDGYNIAVLIDQIHRNRNAFDVGRYFPVFLSAAPWAAEVPEDIRLDMIRSSVGPGKDRKAPQPQVVLERLDERQRAYLQQKPSRYVLVTSISVATYWRLGRRVARGCELCFLKRIPQPFLSPQASRKRQLQGYPDHPASYKKVTASILARSPSEALQRGLDSLDFFRGIWNFGLRRGNIRMPIAGSPHRPYNWVLLGPRFTVHNEDDERDEHGKIVPRVVGDFMPYSEVQPISRTAEVNAIRSAEKRITHALPQIPYAAEVEKGLIRFCRALDEHDLNACLLKLWAVLEHLTATGGDRYDVLVRRVSALWNEVEPHRSVLQHLRVIRNEQVHSGEGSQLAETLVNQLKFYVEQLLIFHLAQGRRFTSLEEAGQFLDLSIQSKVLKRQIYLRRAALGIRSGTVHKR